MTSPSADMAAEALRLAALASDFSRRLELEPDVVYPAHADCLWRLGHLRIAEGAFDEGLLAVAEAVALYRAIALSQPEAYALQLATLLNTQSKLLADADHLEEARAVAADAVERAQVAMEHSPGEARFVLVSALVNRGGLRLRCGEPAAALEELTKAAEIFRAGGSAGHQYLGAMIEALHNAAMAFAEVELWAEAVAARRIMLEVFDGGAPGAVVQLLALTLQQASVGLARTGRPDVALTAAEEAASLMRGLHAEAPDENRLPLAQSLGNLAARLHGVERNREGLDLSLEAVDLFHQVVAEDPLHAVPPLIMTLDGMAAILAALNLPDQAEEVRGQRAQLQETLEIIAPRRP